MHSRFHRNLGNEDNGSPLFSIKSLTMLTSPNLLLYQREFMPTIILHARHSLTFAIWVYCLSQFVRTFLVFEEISSSGCTLQLNSIRFISHSFSNRKTVKWQMAAQSVKQHFTFASICFKLSSTLKPVTIEQVVDAVTDILLVVKCTP